MVTEIRHGVAGFHEKLKKDLRASWAHHQQSAAHLDKSKQDGSDFFSEAARTKGREPGGPEVKVAGVSLQLAKLRLASSRKAVGRCAS
jgi:hypothetical protein